MKNKIISGLVALVSSCSWHQPLSYPSQQIQDSSDAIHTIEAVLNTRGTAGWGSSWGIKYNACEVLGCNADISGFSCNLICHYSGSETQMAVRKEYSEIRNIGCEDDSALIFWKGKNYEGFFGDSPTEIDFNNAANYQSFITAVFYLKNPPRN